MVERHTEKGRLVISQCSQVHIGESVFERGEKEEGNDSKRAEEEVKGECKVPFRGRWVGWGRMRERGQKATQSRQVKENHRGSGERGAGEGGGVKNLGMRQYQRGMQYNTPAKKTPQMKKYGGQICSNIILGV